ncbi:MAG: hemin receptor, partial [Prevotella sp.]|nr:hemin receptor [Prevotella sp.]
RYMMDRKNSGYIGSYDFNISGNINDRVYLGLTVGLHDVHYKGYSEYAELFAPNVDAVDGVLVEDTREITGSGVDVKAGVIFRPVAESPFRIGLSVATPTWYDLTTRNHTAMVVDDKNYGTYSMSIGNEYDFKLYTPWKFGLSLGHTIDRYLALGASYEYADYGSLDSRIINGYSWDGYEDTSSDLEMNGHTSKTLKGVHTVKVGAEFKPDNDISVRLGFNYLSPMYNSNGIKDGCLDSYGISYSSSTDFTNWKDTYRVTAGIGYRLDKFSIDLAYQYSQTNGTFRPFSDVLDATNTADAVDVSNKRHQMLLSLGYTF